MSVCKMFFLNLMKKCWLAPVRVLASSETKTVCQRHLVLPCLFVGKYKTLEFRRVVRFRHVDIGALRLQRCAKISADD